MHREFEKESGMGRSYIIDRTQSFAPWWKLMLARIFGKRVEARDYDMLVVGYRWRGVLYLSYFKQGD